MDAYVLSLFSPLLRPLDIVCTSSLGTKALCSLIVPEPCYIYMPATRAAPYPQDSHRNSQVMSSRCPSHSTHPLSVIRFNFVVVLAPRDPATFHFLFSFRGFFEYILCNNKILNR